jgi:hypothetical protein
MGLAILHIPKIMCPFQMFFRSSFFLIHIARRYNKRHPRNVVSPGDITKDIQESGIARRYNKYINENAVSPGDIPAIKTIPPNGQLAERYVSAKNNGFLTLKLTYFHYFSNFNKFPGNIYKFRVGIDKFVL